jgi:hypothetical protein
LNQGATLRAPLSLARAARTEDFHEKAIENGRGTQLLDEIEDVAPGEIKRLRIDLAKGNYVLICNMVHVEDDGSLEVHYALGMRTAFRVE